MEELNNYSRKGKVRVILFVKNPQTNEIELLLYKNNSEPNPFQIIQTDFEESDNASTFSSARKLITSFGGLFTSKVLEKLEKGEALDKEDKQYPHDTFYSYQLWEIPLYNVYLDMISSNIPQYEEMPNEIVYFLQLSKYIKLETFNSLYTDKTFEYYTKSNQTSIEIDETFKNILTHLPLDKMHTFIETSLQEITRKQTESELDYIVLACKTKGQDQVGFFHFPALFQGLYRRNNELWSYKVTSSEEFPTEAELSKCKCLIIPGSNLSVYNEIDFLRKTEKYLKQLIDDILFNNKYPQLRLLGICFGMQIFLSALDAKVIRGVHQPKPEDIEMSDKFWNYSFVKASGVQQTKYLRISQAHADFVKEYPPDKKYEFNLDGVSKSCPCEVMVDSQEKIFMIQGHPEYCPAFNTPRVAKMFIKFFLKEEPTHEKILDFIEKNLSDEKSQNVNFIEWRKLCYTFMKQPR